MAGGLVYSNGWRFLRRTVCLKRFTEAVGESRSGFINNLLQGGDLRCIMEIRHLEKDDSRLAISRVYEESWKYAYKDIIPGDYLESIPEGSWAAHIDDPGRNTLIMIEDGIIIGTSTYCRSRYSEMDGVGEISSIYLLPGYMGKGLGRQLLDEAVKGLESLGFKDIFLWVLEENNRARHFYEKSGFWCSEVYLEDNIGGRKLREVQYRYQLK